MLSPQVLKIVGLFVALELFVVGGLGALAARRFGFAYEALTPVAFIVYGLAGYFVARVGGPAWLAGATVGFLDALSWATFGGFGPQPTGPDQPVGAKLFAVVFVTASATALGALGGWLYSRGAAGASAA